jgi:hypothetical protein
MFSRSKIEYYVIKNKDKAQEDKMDKVVRMLGTLTTEMKTAVKGRRKKQKTKKKKNIK